MRRTCHLHCVKMVFALPFEVCSDVAAPFLGNAIALHLRDVFIKFLCCIQSGNAWEGGRGLRMEPGFEKYFIQTVVAQVSAECPPFFFICCFIYFQWEGLVMSSCIFVGLGA